MQAKAAELRERALPDSGEDRAKDVASYRVSKRIRELETERDQGLSEVRKELEGTDAWRAAIGREIAYIEHRLGSLPWPSEADVAAKNAERLQSTDGDALLSYALANTDWDARRWSSEELVLVALLARRRVELAAPKEAWVVRDTLARALAWLGRGDEALAMADSAIALAGKLANWARRNKEHMQAELASWTGEARRKREAKLVEPRRELADLPSVESIERALEPKEASVSADYGARIADVQQNAPRGTWRFGRSDDEWWHAQLAALESDLAGLEQMRAAAHEANRTERAQRLWSEAIESIERSAKYAGQLWPSG